MLSNFGLLLRPTLELEHLGLFDEDTDRVAPVASLVARPTMIFAGNSFSSLLG